MSFTSRPLLTVCAIALSRFSGLLIQVGLARAFTPELFGEFVFVFGLFGLALPALTLSLTDVATYLSMRRKDEQAYFEMSLKFLPWNAVLFGAAVLGVGWVAGDFFLAGMLGLFLFAQFVFYLLVQPQRLFPAKGDFFLLVAWYNVLLGALLVALLMNGAGFEALPVAAVSAMAATLIAFRSAREHVRMLFSQEFGWPTAVEKKQVWSFGATNLVSQAALNIELIVLGLVLTAGDLAQYRSASIVLLGVMAIPAVLYAYLAPAIAANSSATRPWDTYMAYLAKAALPCAILLCAVWFGASMFFELVFGSSYAQGREYMQMMLPMMAIGLLVRVPAGNILAYTGSSRLNAINGLIGLLVSGFAIYFAASLYGVPGAIAGATLSWAVTALVAVGFIRKAASHVD